MSESLTNQIKVAVKQSLGGRIRGIRLVLGVTLEGFAKKVGVSKSTISKWERGESSPSAEHFHVIAELGGITVKELLGANDPQLSLINIKEGQNVDLYELLNLKGISISYKGKELTEQEYDKMKTILKLFFE